LLGQGSRELCLEPGIGWFRPPDPCQSLAIPPFVGVTDLSSPQPFDSTTQPLNHSTSTGHSTCDSDLPALDSRTHNYLLQLPAPLLPIAQIRRAYRYPSLQLQLQPQPQPQSGRLHHVSHRAVLASHPPQNMRNLAKGQPRGPASFSTTLAAIRLTAFALMCHCHLHTDDSYCLISSHLRLHLLPIPL
jgi:hypothetical protein